MANGSNKSQIGVWIDDELRERVESAAGREGRSISSFVRETLRRQLEIEARIYEENHNTRSERAAA